MATQAELIEDLKLVLSKQTKTLREIASVQAAVTELKAKIAELEQVISTGTVSDELAAAVAAVRVQAQAVDDAIPDVEPPADPPSPAP